MVDIAKDRNSTDPRLDGGRLPRTDDGQHERREPAAAPEAAATRYLLAGIRLALGWIFLWAFLDKTFGLGHETIAAKSWLNGGSPTKGFWARRRRARSPGSTTRSPVRPSPMCSSWRRCWVSASR
jgi:thiosulfate dehydrogenase [quinone] large subunit